MSNILMIRHLPETLTLQEKEMLLKHFGAEKVWETKSKRNYVFASFSSVDHAKLSLHRLHQLKIAQRRLVVEFSQESEILSSNSEPKYEASTITKHVKKFLKHLNAWNPSVDFYQPPPPHLKYKYPEPTSQIYLNIMYALITHRPLYIQTLHLMNKMTLDSPFQENRDALLLFKNTFRDYFLDELSILPPESEEESEISSEDGDNKHPNVTAPIVVKRKTMLPKTRKRPYAVLSTATIPKAKKKVRSQENVFEEITIQEPKKISLVVPQDVLEKQIESEHEVTGEIGKFHKEDRSEDCTDTAQEPEKPTITKKELLQNRLSYRDMKHLPVFKNYHPGPPSMRLYLKNLAKSVTDQDIMRIYRRYIENLTDIEQIGFDVRVMQEGRMKGQGFVTFPSVAVAEVALNETNGYILKDKPMVVQFARVANKKPIE